MKHMIHGARLDTAFGFIDDGVHSLASIRANTLLSGLNREELRGSTLLVLTFAPGAIAGGASTQRSKEI